MAIGQIGEKMNKEERKKIDRQNALKGSEKTKGKPRGKSKYGTRSWGFNERPGNKGTTPRKYGKGKSILAHIFKAGRKNITLILRKEKKGRGKQPFTATFLENGKAQSDLDNRLKVEATTFREVQKKAVKEFKRR